MSTLYIVVPAKGDPAAFTRTINIHARMIGLSLQRHWVPAFAGTTMEGGPCRHSRAARKQGAQAGRASRRAQAGARSRRANRAAFTVVPAKAGTQCRSQPTRGHTHQRSGFPPSREPQPATSSSPRRRGPSGVRCVRTISVPTPLEFRLGANDVELVRAGANHPSHPASSGGSSIAAICSRSSRIRSCQ
jgi:hypothetical protein